MSVGERERDVLKKNGRGMGCEGENQVVARVFIIMKGWWCIDVDVCGCVRKKTR